MDGPRGWADLGKDEQLALREAYAKTQQRQPGTCSMELKIARFAVFRAENGVAFSADDLKKR